MEAIPRSSLEVVGSQHLLDPVVKSLYGPSDVCPRDQLIKGCTVDAPTQPGFQILFAVGWLLFFQEQPVASSTTLFGGLSPLERAHGRTDQITLLSIPRSIQ